MVPPPSSCMTCHGSAKYPPSPEGEPARLAELPVFPEVPNTSPFKRKRISIQERQQIKEIKANGPASWSTASRLSRPEDMAEFRAIFEDKAFLGQGEPEINPTATLRPSTAVTPEAESQTTKPSIELLTLPSELERRKSSHSLAQALKDKLSFSKIRKQLSRESTRLSLHAGKRASRQATATGSSEEEIERRAELRRLRTLRIQKELEEDGFDSDAKSIETVAPSAVSSVKTRVAEMREQLKSPGSVELLQLHPDHERGGFEWTPGKLSTHALFAISGRESNAIVMPTTPLTPKGTATERPRRHSMPGELLPDLDVEFYTPTHPNKDSIPGVDQPPTPTIHPVRLPSIEDETARRTSWRLSYASERRASHLRSLSGQHPKSVDSLNSIPIHPLAQELGPTKLNPLLKGAMGPPTPAPLRTWLHSQGLRISSEVIDDNSSGDESGPESAKKLHVRKMRSTEDLYNEANHFGGVDGSREHSPVSAPVLHLHQMGISQRLASRGLASCASSPQLSTCGSRFDGGHRRGISGFSSYSKWSAFSPPSARSRYQRQISNDGSKNSRSRSDSNAPYSVRSRHQQDPKSQKNSSSDQTTGFISFISPDLDSVLRAVDGSSSVYETPAGSKNTLFFVPSRKSSAQNSPQSGVMYKTPTGKGSRSSDSQDRDGRPAGKDRVKSDLALADEKVSEDSDLLARSSGADTGNAESLPPVPMNVSMLSLNKPIARWMAARSSTFDETSFNEANRPPTLDYDSSGMASETQSFKEREKQLIGIKKRFTMSGKYPKAPVQSKFKEEFGRPSLSFHGSSNKHHSFLSMLHLPLKRNSVKKKDGKDHPKNFDGPAIIDSVDGPDDEASGDHAAGESIEMTASRGPPRGPRAGGRPGGKPPKAAPVMAPAMAPAMGPAPTQGQKKRAMRQKLASWEDELAAVEKAARDKSKGVAPVKTRKRRDNWDPAKWSSFPSHDRYERTESAGSADRIEQTDFAIKARTPSGNVAEWNHSERKHPAFDYDEDHEDAVPLTMPQKIRESIRNSILGKRVALTFETDASNGRRSSISAGGDLEFPELEIVQGTERSNDFDRMEAEIEEALQLEAEMKAMEIAAEKKRQEAIARRAQMQKPPGVDGSMDGEGFVDLDEEDRLMSDSLHVADPRFYDDCVVEPLAAAAVDDGANMVTDTISIHSARTTGSIQFEMERPIGSKGDMVSLIEVAKSGRRKKEKFETWNGRAMPRKLSKKRNTVHDVYGVRDYELRESTLSFQRELVKRKRAAMERILGDWGVGGSGLGGH